MDFSATCGKCERIPPGFFSAGSQQSSKYETCFPWYNQYLYQVWARYHLLDTAQFCWEGVKMLRNDGFSCWNFISKVRYLKTESNIVLSVHFLDSTSGPNCLKRVQVSLWVNFIRKVTILNFPDFLKFQNLNFAHSESQKNEIFLGT